MYNKLKDLWQEYPYHVFLMCISLIAFLVVLISEFIPETITEHSLSVYPESVYIHNVNRYSYSIIDENGFLINKRTCFNNKVIIDSSLEKSVYNENWKKHKQFLNNRVSELVCELKIPSVDNIRDSGWNNGKFGSGRTTRIE